LVRMSFPRLGEPLDVCIDVPESAAAAGGGATLSDAERQPLRILLYFHGHGEDYRLGPKSVPGLAVVSANCPRSVGGKRCFWFQEGAGGAWERHEHAKLRKCDAMLEAMAAVLDASSAALAALDWPVGIDAQVCLMGVSMGGHAALEFARSAPGRVRCLAVAAGYYQEPEMEELLKSIASIPLLLAHRTGDRCCPFGNIQRLHRLRLALPATPAAVTDSWFEEGIRHGPTDEELQDVIRWVLAQSR